MRKLVAGALLACSLSGGCRHLLPAVEEPIRIANTQDTSPERLGFEKGKTSFDEAAASMKSIGLTGVARTMYTDITAKGPSLVLQALSADYQTKVHIFENGYYSGSVAVPSGKVVPYGEALTISSRGKDVFLLALYRDPLEMTAEAWRAEAPRIDIFERTAGTFVFRSRFSLKQIAADNEGITHPIFVGHDLSMGVMLLARDRRGTIWDGAYFLKLENGLVKATHASLNEVSRCSCVQRYMYGEDVESLWKD